MTEFSEKGWLEGVAREDNFVVNLHVFRNYLEDFLRNHPRVNERLTIMVRQLQPTAQGLPLELYFFSDGTDWIPYEHLQSEIFEHVFAMMPVFGLRVFQSPMGEDFVRQ
jgi:miniconductance mechanosensitive channel